MINNIVVNNQFVKPDDFETLFGEEEVQLVPETDLPTLLVSLGVYPSTTKARNAGRKGDIPKGFSGNFKASKKVHLDIWNPTE